jgi:hypothetical protein
MEHDQRACPRCGEPAGEYHYCPSCLAPIESLGGTATTTLAASSDGNSDRGAGETSAAAVQVEPSVDGATAAPGSGMRLEGGAGDVSQAPPEVARLEDVLSVAPRPSTHDTTNSTPPPRAELPIRLEGRIGDLARAPREVARLEDVLSVASDLAGDLIAREAPAAPVEVDPDPRTDGDPTADANTGPVEQVKLPRSVETPPAARTYVAAHRLRSAFLFEQVSAFESRVDDDEDEIVGEALAASVAEVGVAETAAPSGQCECHTQAYSAQDEPREETSRSHWMSALCLIALIALVIVLTGRKPRCSNRVQAA